MQPGVIDSLPGYFTPYTSDSMQRLRPSDRLLLITAVCRLLATIPENGTLNVPIPGDDCFVYSKENVRDILARLIAEY